MSRIIQEVVEECQSQHFRKDVVDHCKEEEEEERELEEALSLCDLPISKVTNGNTEDEAEHDQEEDQIIAGDILDNTDFDFGPLVGSRTALDDEMCTADEVFSGGQILPYRNSVSSMSGLRSDSMDRRGFGSRSSSSRSSSIRSHYSATSSSGSSSCSNNTNISTKTIPLVSRTKVVQNQFHSYPSPKPQILGSGLSSGTRVSTYTPPIGKKSKMWEVLKLGLVRTPEIELRDLKLRQRTNNSGKTVTITRNNSVGSNSSIKAGNINNIDRARKSCSNDGKNVTNFVLEMQKRRTQLSETKIDDNSNSNNNGFFKSCKCSVAEIIEPMPSTRSDYGVKSGYYKFTTNQIITSSANQQVLNEDKSSGQKNDKLQMMVKEQKQQKRRNSNFRQEKQVTSHHHHHHHHRTFEWLKSLSHASVLNDS